MSVSEKIPLYLVTGFLGSGKTTFAKAFIRKYADRYRIVVVQNEFAPVNIDGREFANINENVKVIELNNGSVFCVCLMPEFMSVLKDLVQQQRFDLVLLEATGLADPIAIAGLFHDPFMAEHLYLAHVWTIVDAAQLERVRQIKSAERQIRLADTVIVNKMDLYTGESLNLDASIHTLNPLADCVRTEYCRIDLPENAASLASYSVREKKLSGIPAKRPDVGTVVVRDTEPVSRDALNGFLDALDEFIYRLKGIVRLAEGKAVSVQVAIGHRKVQDIAGTYNAEFIIIGPGIEQDQVKQLWQESKKQKTNYTWQTESKIRG